MGLVAFYLLQEVARLQWQAGQRQERAGGKPASKVVEAREDYQQQRLTLWTTVGGAVLAAAVAQEWQIVAQLLGEAGLQVPALLLQLIVEVPAAILKVLTGSMLVGAAAKFGMARMQRSVTQTERSKALAAQRDAVATEAGRLQAAPQANAQQLLARSDAAPTAVADAALTAAPGGQATPRRLLEARQHAVSFSAQMTVWVGCPRGAGVHARVVGLQPTSGRHAQFVPLHYLGCSTCLP